MLGAVGTAVEILRQMIQNAHFYEQQKEKLSGFAKGKEVEDLKEQKWQDSESGSSQPAHSS